MPRIHHYRAYATDARKAVPIRVPDGACPYAVAARELGCAKRDVVMRYEKTIAPVAPRVVTCWMGEDGKVRSQ